MPPVQQKKKENKKNKNKNTHEKCNQKIKFYTTLLFVENAKQSNTGTGICLKQTCGKNQRVHCQFTAIC